MEERKENFLFNGTEYICKNGKTLNVAYFTTENNGNHARIQFDGVQSDLKRVPSASGEK